jgi:hypothetical protein
LISRDLRFETGEGNYKGGGKERDRSKSGFEFLELSNAKEDIISNASSLVH